MTETFFQSGKVFGENTWRYQKIQLLLKVVEENIHFSLIFKKNFIGEEIVANALDSREDPRAPSSLVLREGVLPTKLL